MLARRGQAQTVVGAAGFNQFNEQVGQGQRLLPQRSDAAQGLCG